MPKFLPRIVAVFLALSLIADPNAARQALARPDVWRASVGTALPQPSVGHRATVSIGLQDNFQEQALAARGIFQPGPLADHSLTSRIFAQCANFLRQRAQRVKEGVSVAGSWEDLFGPLHRNFVRRHPERFSLKEQFLLWGFMYSAVAWGLRSVGFHWVGDINPASAYAMAVLFFIVSYGSARWLDSLRKQGRWSWTATVLASPVLVLLLSGHLAYNITAAILGLPLASLPQVPDGSYVVYQGKLYVKSSEKPGNVAGQTLTTYLLKPVGEEHEITVWIVRPATVRLASSEEIKTTLKAIAKANEALQARAEELRQQRPTKRPDKDRETRSGRQWRPLIIIVSLLGLTAWALATKQAEAALIVPFSLIQLLENRIIAFRRNLDWREIESAA